MSHSSTTYFPLLSAREWVFPFVSLMEKAGAASPTTAGPVACFDFVPSLWAERRVAALLDEIRLHGAEEEPMRLDLGSLPFTDYEDSIFNIDATLQPDASLEQVNAIIERELARFIAEGPTEEELERAKTKINASTVRGLEQIGGFGGKAVTLAQQDGELVTQGGLGGLVPALAALLARAEVGVGSGLHIPDSHPPQYSVGRSPQFFTEVDVAGGGQHI